MNKTKLLYIALVYFVPSSIIILIRAFININGHMVASILLVTIFILLSNLFLVFIKRWVVNKNKAKFLWDWAFETFSFKKNLLDIIVIMILSIISSRIANMF